MKSASRSALMLFLAVVFAIGPLLAQDEPSDEAPRLITLEDYGAVRSPESPRVSPDGNQICYLLDDQIFLVSAEYDMATSYIIGRVENRFVAPRLSPEPIGLRRIDGRAVHGIHKQAAD